MKWVTGIVSGLAGMVFVVASVSIVYAQTAQPDAKAALTARLEERRTRLAIKLNPTDSARVKANCVAAQAKIAAVTKGITENNQSFQSRYDTYTKQLQAAQKDSKTAGKDTAALDVQVDILGQKYRTYKTAYDQLELSLGDSKSVDCATEPNGFKATVIDIRSQLITMQDAQRQVTTQAGVAVTDTLKALKASTGVNP